MRSVLASDGRGEVMSNSAASFVDQINTEYREVVKAERAALPHAIKCGELLNHAKENVKAEKMKWGDWLKVNCPEISQETASLYMRIAEHKRLVSKAKSIREARDLLPKAKPRGRQLEISNGVTNSTDPAVVLQATGADEIIANIQDDEDKLEEVAKASITKLSPDKVCDVLTKTWSAEQLHDLAKRVNAYLATLTVTAPSSSYRRAPTQPTVS
jgi:hypothetical protein